jgi:hypothetical protein
VEHTLPQLESPWRTATLVACAVAAVELVVLVALGVALFAEPVAQGVSRAAERQVFAPAAKPRPKPAAGTPTLTRAETSVIVLNGNGRAGAAAATAERVRGRGYAIGSVGNAPRTDYTRTLVMFRAGHEAEARRLAKDLGVKIVGPLDGLRPHDLLGAHVAVVVGD